MMARPVYVIDANVGVAFVLPEQLSDKAANVFEAVHAGSADVVAPGFWLLECGNALWKRARRGEVPVEIAVHAFQRLERAPVGMIDPAMLLTDAFNLALVADVTTYDALYAATALFVGAPLITADERLASALEQHLPDLALIRLAEWKAPNIT